MPYNARRSATLSANVFSAWTRASASYLVYPGKPLRQLGVEPIELGLRVTSGVVGREHFTLHFPRATAEGCGRGPRRRVVVPRE